MNNSENVFYIGLFLGDLFVICWFVCWVIWIIKEIVIEIKQRTNQ